MDFSVNEERAKKIAAMRAQKERQLRNRELARKYFPFALGGVVVCAAAISISMNAHFRSTDNQQSANLQSNEIVADTYVINESSKEEAVDENPVQEEKAETREAIVQLPPEPETTLVGDTEVFYGYRASIKSACKLLGEEEIPSEFACLINAATGEIIAQKNAVEKMYPASMTKIMTALVACEQITDPDEKVIMTIESTDYAYANDCSSAGFLVDEELTVRDLLYGTILPSGGEAAHALALHVAGSQEAFVELMNQKVEELGLSETTHFENCVGIFSKENYSTCHDIAMILKAAVENDLCREILSAKRSTTSQTAQHPEGINLSNLFLRRIEDKETGGDVLCAKTGFVNQSGSCAASYFVSKDGVPYFCVTGKSTSSWRAIYDHVYLYSTYAKTTE